MSDTDVLRPEWLAFEKELGFRPLLHGPTFDDIVAQDGKNGMALMSKYTFPSPDGSVAISETRTPNGVRIKIYKPSNLEPGKPLVVYIHGGGYAMGTADIDDGFVCRHAKDSGLIFVSVDYRLTPKHPFPAGLDDCKAAFDWAVENAESLDAMRGKVALMGGSAGATLALGTALMAIDAGQGAAVQGVIAGVPISCHPDAVPKELKSRYTSYDEHAEHTVDTKAAMKVFLDIYGAPPDDKYASPLLHPRLGELPRVYLNVCGADTLRDDGRLLKERLEQNEVPTQYDEYEKLPHYFFAFPSSHLDGLRTDYFERTAKGIAFVIS